MLLKNFFKGISFTQVLAGSLAAVTAFLLSSKIGIAGSVIGVAIGSIVSAVASQLYQNVIHASSKKIQSSSALKSDSSRYGEDDTKVVNNARFIALEDNMPKEYDVYNNMGEPSKEKQARRVVAMASNANVANFAGDLHDSSVAGDSLQHKNSEAKKWPALSAESTSVMELSSLRKMKEEDNSLSEGNPDSLLTLNDAKRALVGRSDYADSEAKHKRLTIVIAILSAIAAVLLTAGIVLLFTQGRGTDNLVPSGQNTEQNNGQNSGNNTHQNSQNNGVQNQDKNSQDEQKSSQDAEDEKDSKDSKDGKDGKDSKDGEDSSSKNSSEKQDKKTREGSSSSLDANGLGADSGNQGSGDSGASGADSGARGSKGDSSSSGDSSQSSSSSSNGASGGSAAQQGESGSQQAGGGE